MGKYTYVYHLIDHHKDQFKILMKALLPGANYTFPSKLSLLADYNSDT